IASVLTHVHCVRREQFAKIVRVTVTNLRLAKGSNPHLEKVTQGAVAALSADKCLDGPAMHEVFARQDRRGEGRGRVVPVQSLNHPQTPKRASGGVGPIYIASL